MTTYTDLYPPSATLIARKFFKLAGNFNHAVPVGAIWMRAMALGCGGLSAEAWGGGGAYARSAVAVVAGENIKVQVGTVSTAGAPGNSWVKRNDDTIICLADRGRGTGPGGQAANSIGDVTRSGAAGSAGIGGNSGSDAADFASLGFAGLGALYLTRSATPGGGGALQIRYGSDGEASGYWESGAGAGMVCLEFFDRNPGY
jgi:hypothetical protein